ncbi:hypothetical protein OEZ85_002427 [Tetradesmus obliquus]|uniref:Uncharacterized protein n=1 Tax=Tetradesmus obliquus TaxID=3088 RepID=A0ABY8TZQ5_TETOB|nr:hypothetical protein OEZ85_002427 [Tetradesmus obliquus]
MKSKAARQSTRCIIKGEPPPTLPQVRALVLSAPYLPSQLQAFHATAAKLRHSLAVLLGGSEVHVVVSQLPWDEPDSDAADDGDDSGSSSTVYEQQQQQRMPAWQRVLLDGLGPARLLGPGQLAAAEDAEDALLAQRRLFSAAEFLLVLSKQPLEAADLEVARRQAFASSISSAAAAADDAGAAQAHYQPGMSLMLAGPGSSASSAGDVAGGSVDAGEVLGARVHVLLGEPLQGVWGAALAALARSRSMMGQADSSMAAAAALHAGSSSSNRPTGRFGAHSAQPAQLSHLAGPAAGLPPAFLQG